MLRCYERSRFFFFLLVITVFVDIRPLFLLNSGSFGKI